MKNPFISVDSTSSASIERKKLQAAWEHFIEGKYQTPEIRPLMLESWQRCMTQGVHPTKSKAPILLPDRVIQEVFTSNPLYPLLSQVLLKLKDVAVDSGHLVVFCNSDGDIIYLDGHHTLRNKAEEMNFILGSSWNEQNAGTNAIGTALVTGTPLQVFAGEHFVQDAHKWACSAAPIRDPATNKPLGILDLTGPWNVIHPHSLSTVASTVHSIEECLRHQWKGEQYTMKERFLEDSLRLPGVPLIALDRGGTVLKASPILYEQGWIDSNDRLVGCPDLSALTHQKTGWEAQGRYGSCYFELVPCYHHNQPIGAMVQVSLPSRANRTPIPTQQHQSHPTKHSFSTMIGASEAFRSVLAEARSAANTHLPVLIEAESGTGKELIAQSIHSASSRSSGPFVAVNCGAIPKELAASEFFGYEEGAFTGSSKGGRAGKFQQAEGGTIFLDEIGEMPLDLQTILLRVLEEGEVVRLGGRKSIQLNVRVIAATNQNLLEAIEKGKFRRDLYYRLNILSLRIPPLRERSSDIKPLLEHHLNQACLEVGHVPMVMDFEAIRMLESYHWPGNVRELRNFAYRMVTKVVGERIRVSDLPSEMAGGKSCIPPLERLMPSSPELAIPKDERASLKDHELQMIFTVLQELNGNVTETAKRLGIHRSTIYRKLGKFPLRSTTE